MKFDNNSSSKKHVATKCWLRLRWREREGGRDREGERVSNGESGWTKTTKRRGKGNQMAAGHFACVCSNGFLLAAKLIGIVFAKHQQAAAGNIHRGVARGGVSKCRVDNIRKF